MGNDRPRRNFGKSGGRDWDRGRDRGRGGRPQQRDRPYRQQRDRPRQFNRHPPGLTMTPGKNVEPLGPNMYKVREGTRVRPATKNLIPGSRVYDERLIKHGDDELRVWDPFRSKFSATILKGCASIPFKRDSRVLYLGAASGTTVSHISDIVTRGVVYAVEFAPRSMRDLFRIAERRPNIVPILADARKPETYSDLVGPVDVVYQDVAQPDQADISVANVRAFMPEGTLVLMIKARSVDVSQQPSKVFAGQMGILKRSGIAIAETKHLMPFEKDHAAVIARVG